MKTLTLEEKNQIVDFWDMDIDKIPDSLEEITQEEWAYDCADFLECSLGEAMDNLDNGQGYNSVSLPTGGMVVIETNGDHMFFVVDMES